MIGFSKLARCTPGLRRCTLPLHRRRPLAPSALPAPTLLAGFALAQSAPMDIVIRNGHIIDGTGSPWYSGDVGIRDGHIAAIGNLAGTTARRTI